MCPHPRNAMHGRDPRVSSDDSVLTYCYSLSPSPGGISLAFPGVLVLLLDPLVVTCHHVLVPLSSCGWDISTSLFWRPWPVGRTGQEPCRTRLSWGFLGLFLATRPGSAVSGRGPEAG